MTDNANAARAALVAAVEYAFDEGVELVGNLGHDNYTRMVKGVDAFRALLTAIEAINHDNALMARDLASVNQAFAVMSDENEKLKARLKDFEDLVKECVSLRDVMGIKRFEKIYHEIWKEREASLSGSAAGDSGSEVAG